MLHTLVANWTGEGCYPMDFMPTVLMNKFELAAALPQNEDVAAVSVFAGHSAIPIVQCAVRTQRMLNSVISFSCNLNVFFTF